MDDDLAQTLKRIEARMSDLAETTGHVNNRLDHIDRRLGKVERRSAALGGVAGTVVSGGVALAQAVMHAKIG